MNPPFYEDVIQACAHFKRSFGMVVVSHRVGEWAAILDEIWEEVE